MNGTARLMFSIAAMATALPATAIGAPELCLAGLAWQGRGESDAGALRERLAQALAIVGIEGASDPETIWCAGDSIETVGLQGQVYVQIVRDQATTRVQLRVVDAATTFTIYQRTVGCPTNDFPQRIDFETALEKALHALRRPPTTDDSAPEVAAAERAERSAQAALRAKGRQRAQRAVQGLPGLNSGLDLRRAPLMIFGWAAAGLSGALALSALATGAQALVSNHMLRQRAAAGGCIERAPSHYVQCDRGLRNDVEFLSLMVWASNGLWASSAIFGTGAALLLWFGYAPEESREDAAAARPARTPPPVGG
ncbi:MAG: hypothetical protein JXR83_01150 [Deltaproteobacteria bacterium]|nr:hypothetical protein [Deltaproteobacteria bacterium]